MNCVVRDLDVHYEEIGIGRPLLMLHGWTNDHRHMVRDMEPLFKNRGGWRRIYPDLPGMGQTRGPDWIASQDQMLEFVSEFMERVAPGARFAVVGTSYGGYLARGLVHRLGNRIDGLLLNAPEIEPDPSKQDYPEHRMVREDAEFLASLTPGEQWMRGYIVSQSPEILSTMREVIVPSFANADNEFLNRLTANYIFTFDVDVLPKPFPGPALILTGRYDSVCGYREAYRILDNYPRGTFAVLDAAGHALSGEHPRLFQALAGDWLNRVEEYSQHGV